MVRVVPERRSLYRTLILVAVVLTGVHYLTPTVSGAAPATNVPDQTVAAVSGVSGAGPTTTPPSANAKGNGQSQDTTSGSTSSGVPDQTGLQVPHGYAPVPYSTPATNTPPPTTPGENP